MKLTHSVLNAERMKWRRKDLRRRSTKAEQLLWGEIRNSKLKYKFKRQYSVMNYVVDFYCYTAKLAIEIDGGIHTTIGSQKYDKYRTLYLKSLGINEIRFNNEKIHRDLNGVISEIKSLLPSPEIRRGNKG